MTTTGSGPRSRRCNFWVRAEQVQSSSRARRLIDNHRPLRSAKEMLEAPSRPRPRSYRTARSRPRSISTSSARTGQEGPVVAVYNHTRINAGHAGRGRAQKSNVLLRADRLARRSAQTLARVLDVPTHRRRDELTRPATSARTSKPPPAHPGADFDVARAQRGSSTSTIDKIAEGRQPVDHRDVPAKRPAGALKILEGPWPTPQGGQSTHQDFIQIDTTNRSSARLDGPRRSSRSVSAGNRRLRLRVDHQADAARSRTADARGPAQVRSSPSSSAGCRWSVRPHRRGPRPRLTEPNA
jgi:hypothetical protein